MAIGIGRAAYGTRPLVLPKKINCRYMLGCGQLATGWAIDKVNGKWTPACADHKVTRAN